MSCLVWLCKSSRPDRPTSAFSVGVCRAAQCDRRTHSDAERTCWAVGPTQFTPPDTTQRCLVLSGGRCELAFSHGIYIDPGSNLAADGSADSVGTAICSLGHGLRFGQCELTRRAARRRVAARDTSRSRSVRRSGRRRGSARASGARSSRATSSCRSRRARPRSDSAASP